MEPERPILETAGAEPQPGHNHEGQPSPPQSAQPRTGNGRGTWPRLGASIAVVAALILGLAGGVLFHQRIGSLVGLSDHSHRAGADGKKQLWTCSMHPQVLKEEPGLCPICQMKLEPLDIVQTGQSAMGGGGSPAAGERKVKYWWDPMMNPPYISDKPGKSPMGMDLVPVYEDQVLAGSAVKIDPVVVQNMGVRVATVGRGPVTRDIRAVGYLDEAQPNVRDVNLRVSGWVEKLHADTVGMALSKGAPLFDLYSPEVQVAAEELIAARKAVESQGQGADALARITARTLLDATRRKLEQWGLDAAEVDRLVKADTPPRTVTFTNPIDGYLTQKMVVQGASVKSGDTVLRIVDLSTLWLDSQIYAQDLPFVRLGQKVTATVEGAAGKQFEGEVIFVHPQVDPQTRTATVRVALPNLELNLRPGMYATAHVQAQVAGAAILVPREAVIDTGTRQVAFVSVGSGHFEPRRVKLGAESDGGMVQVLEGLAPGETVVTSGQFLLDAESRMREAIQKHLSERLLAGASPDPATKATPTTPPAPVEHTSHAANGHDAHASPPASTKPAATAVATTLPGNPDHVGHADRPPPPVDPLFVEYLAIQKQLGGPQQADRPVEVAGLVTAAQAVLSDLPAESRQAPQKVLEGASAMRDKPLAEQRKLFKTLSDAVIAVARGNPPTRAVADRLYVAHCPMAPGQGARWLQTSEAIANPYFATSMKNCGSIEQELKTAPVEATAPARK